MKNIFHLAFYMLLSIDGAAQIKNIRQVYQTIISERIIELNGGLRSQFGRKSRVSLKIDLPPNTVEWYYSFTTRTSASGTENLNLALQLGAMLTASPTGITTMTIKSIKIPTGISSLDVYLCDAQNIQLFEQK